MARLFWRLPRSPVVARAQRARPALEELETRNPPSTLNTTDVWTQPLVEAVGPMALRRDDRPTPPSDTAGGQLASWPSFGALKPDPLARRFPGEGEGTAAGAPRVDEDPDELAWLGFLGAGAGVAGFAGEDGPDGPDGLGPEGEGGASVAGGSCRASLPPQILDFTAIELFDRWYRLTGVVVDEDPVYLIIRFGGDVLSLAGHTTEVFPVGWTYRFQMDIRLHPEDPGGIVIAHTTDSCGLDSEPVWDTVRPVG